VAPCCSYVISCPAQAGVSPCCAPERTHLCCCPHAARPRAQGFKATFQKTAFSAEEWQEQLQAPEPPFEMLTVADLVPAEHREAYEAAGGELY